MAGRDAAMRSANRALELVGQRVAAHPTYGVYVHAEQQLRRVIEALVHPFPISASERHWLDIGLMAARELEATDPALADALMDADHDFRQAT